MDPTRDSEDNFPDAGPDELDEESYNPRQDKENWTQGPLQKSVTDLENYLVNTMAQTCKLHACLFPFLQIIKKLDDRRYYWSSKDLLDFIESPGENTERIECAIAELREKITHLLPGFLEDENDILRNENLRKAVCDADYSMRRDCTTKCEGEYLYSYFSPPPKSPTEPTGFQKLLMDSLELQKARRLPPSAGGNQSENHSRKLSSIALGKVCAELGKRIVGEKATASFTCGGSIFIQDRRSAQNRDTKRDYSRSSPVQIWWASKDGRTKERLILPLNRSPNECPDSSVPRLHQLVADCDVASFGKGQQDVIDPEYRKAGKLDPQRFSSSFHPADFGIIECIEKVLLPRFNSETENILPFRRLTAELYKLNVYSGPSGLFQKHVDTPRSEDQIGSLVVCLPSPFEGGDLVVRHHGREVDFEWSSQSAWEIQWAAFYSDCEHEIKTITAGERITLTYNLYLTEPMGELSPGKSVISPKSMPMYSDLREVLREPGFMMDGGVLGIPCSHAYPHASAHAKELLPSGLKAADLAVYSALRTLGVEAKVLPVMKQSVVDSYLEGEKAAEFVLYLKEGKEFAVEYQQFPGEIPIDEDVDRYWKTLYSARHPVGIEGFLDLAQEVDWQLTSKEFWMNRGAFIGADLTPYTTINMGGEDVYMIRIMDNCWENLYHPSITWITRPKHEEMAFSHLVYGNEASISTTYSHAAIIAIVPPFGQRRLILGETSE